MKQTDKNIKEIRIYHSLWKNILLTVGCFAFAAGGYFILHDANTSWPTKVFGGIGSMVFFGCGGMLIFMMTLYNITTHIPFLIIHDDRLDIYEQRKRTYRTIYFNMQYFEQSNENMEVELQLIIVLLSFYSTRQILY